MRTLQDIIQLTDNEDFLRTAQQQFVGTYVRLTCVKPLFTGIAYISDLSVNHLYFQPVTENEVIKAAIKDCKIEIIMPEPMLVQVGPHICCLSPMAQRQYKKSLSTGTHNFWITNTNSRGSFEMVKNLFYDKTPYLSLDEIQAQRPGLTGYALNKHFYVYSIAQRLQKDNLYYRGLCIGTINFKTKEIQVSSVFEQEIQDILNRTKVKSWTLKRTP